MWTIRSFIVAWLPFNDSFTIVPIAWMFSNAILACLLGEFVLGTSDDFPALLEKGKTMLNLVANASISIVTLTFSLTVLSVQIAAQTYSPRLLDEFIKDPMSKLVIAVNLGAYVYCFILNYFLDGGGDDFDGRIPVAAIHVLTLQMWLVLLSFVNFIHFFIHNFRIEEILSRASESSLRAARALQAQYEAAQNNHRKQTSKSERPSQHETRSGQEESSEVSSSSQQNKDPDETLVAPASAYKVLADTSGYVSRFQLQQLAKAASKMDVCCKYNYAIGQFVTEGAILAYVWDAATVTQTACDEGDESESKTECLPLPERVDAYMDFRGTTNVPDSWEDKVEFKLGLFCGDGVVISPQRNGDYDVTLGIQQLADIAVRALSAAINDPYTAIQCLNVLSSLLVELAEMELGIPNAYDKDGILRATAPHRSFSFMLSMLDSIRRYGGEDLAVCRRGLRIFGDLAAILTRSRRLDRVPPCLAQMEQWMVVCRQSFREGSPELETLQDLYTHLLKIVLESDAVLLEHVDSTEKDLDQFDITHTEKQGVKRTRSVVKEMLSHAALETAESEHKERETVLTTVPKSQRDDDG